MATRKSFILYLEFEEQFNYLSLEDCGILIRALFQYAKTHTVPEGMSPLVAMAFSFMKQAIDRNQHKYELQCERNSVNGKKGGRPKKEKDKISSESKTQQNPPVFQKPNKTLCDSDCDCDCDCDRDCDCGCVCEQENLALRATSVSDGTHTETKEKNFSFFGLEGTEEAEAISQGATLATDSVSHEAEEDMGDIPRVYIERRWERALLYAKKQRISPHALIRSWWEEDRALYEDNKKEILAAKERGALKSYDLDDFFEAALQRAMDDTPE